MIVRDGVEVLLRVESTSWVKSQVAIGSLDDVCDFVNGLTTIKGVLVCDAVFNNVGECYA